MYTNITPSIAGSQLGLEIFSNQWHQECHDPSPALGARSLHRRKVGIQNKLHVLGDRDLSRLSGWIKNDKEQKPWQNQQHHSQHLSTLPQGWQHLVLRCLESL